MKDYKDQMVKETKFLVPIVLTIIVAVIWAILVIYQI